MTEQLDGLRIAIAPQLKFSRIAFPLLWLASMYLATSDPKTYERQYDFIIIVIFASVFRAATLHMLYSTLWQLFGREELHLTPLAYPNVTISGPPFTARTTRETGSAICATPLRIQADRATQGSPSTIRL